MAQRSGVTIELEMDQGALVRRYHFDNSNKPHSAAPQRWIDISADYLVGPYRERYHIKSYRARWPELDFIMGPGVRPWGDQLRQELRAADQEYAVALHLLQANLGRVLPGGGAAGHALGLLGERLLGEEIGLTHAAAA